MDVMIFAPSQPRESFPFVSK